MEAYLGKALSLVTLDAVVVWIIPALICFSVCYLRCRSGKMRLRSCLALSMLIFYLGFVASITLLSRQAAPFARMELELFWSYRLISAGDKGMFFEVFWNVVLFMPYGFLASIHSRSKAKWTVFLSGSLLSVAIELTQLFTHRGLFEYDDIVHNTLGTSVGIALCLIASKVLINLERKYNIQLT